MSWCINEGPSFNITRPGNSYQQLTGFTQRFMLREDDPRMTPGKKHPHLPAETMKGSTKLKKHQRQIKEKPCKDLIMPKGNPEPIYGGFAKSKPNKATTKVVKPKRKKMRRKRVK